MKRRTLTFASPPSLGMGFLLLAVLSFGVDPRAAPEADGPCSVGHERIAVAALAGEARAPISPLGGRAPYFLLFESGSNRIEIVANEYAAREKAAGTHAAYLLAELEVDCLVAGEVGERMRSVLETEGIAFAVAEGRALEVARAAAVIEGAW